MAWDFQQWGILTSVDSEKPVQSHFKLKNPKWYAQADLSLCWSHIPHCLKSQVTAQLIDRSRTFQKMDTYGSVNRRDTNHI